MSTTVPSTTLVVNDETQSPLTSILINAKPQAPVRVITMDELFANHLARLANPEISRDAFEESLHRIATLRRIFNQS